MEILRQGEGGFRRVRRSRIDTHVFRGGGGTRGQGREKGRRLVRGKKGVAEWRGLGLLPLSQSREVGSPHLLVLRCTLFTHDSGVTPVPRLPEV